MKKLTKKQKKFKKRLDKTMSVLRGSYQKVVAFSKRQSKSKFMWDELK